MRVFVFACGGGGGGGYVCVREREGGGVALFVHILFSILWINSDFLRVI